MSTTYSKTRVFNRRNDDLTIEVLANFIIRNFDVICRANDFVNLPYFVLVKVIESSNSIRLVREDNLFLAIHRWLMHDPPRTDIAV